jgi:hypothetical protein
MMRKPQPIWIAAAIGLAEAVGYALALALLALGLV